MYDYLAKIILLGPSGTGKYVIIEAFGEQASHRKLSFATVALLHQSL